MGANNVIGNPMGIVSFITRPLDVIIVVNSFNEYAFNVT
jgi:hypothetical protein